MLEITATENKKGVMSAVFGNFSGGSYRPQIGVYNIENESIQATSTDTADHYYRGPYCE